MTQAYKERDMTLPATASASNFPIIQAPMAGVQGSALAIAVSNAGGLGSLPCALLDPDGIAREARGDQAQARRPFNVNFFCHAPPPGRSGTRSRLARSARAVLPRIRHRRREPSQAGPGRAPFERETAASCSRSSGPPVVSFHFGLPSDELLARVRAVGREGARHRRRPWTRRAGSRRAASTRSSRRASKRAAIAAFSSPTTSTTQVGTMALVPQIVHAVSVPVIAAGGIADARGVEAALRSAPPACRSAPRTCCVPRRRRAPSTARR